MSAAEKHHEYDKKGILSALLGDPSVDKIALLKALAIITRTEFHDLTDYEVDKNIVRNIPEKILRKYGFVPIKVAGTHLTITLGWMSYSSK